MEIIIALVVLGTMAWFVVQRRKKAKSQVGDQVVPIEDIDESDLENAETDSDHQLGR